MLQLSKPSARRHNTIQPGPQRAYTHCKLPVRCFRYRCDKERRCYDVGRVAAANSEQQTLRAYTGFSAKSLFVDTHSVFGKLVWPAVWLYGASELANVILNRITHRLVNGLFLAIHGGSYTADMLGESLWFLSLNPAITTFASGYNYISYGIILLAFPLTLLISTACHLALFDLAFQVLDTTPPPKPPPPIRAASAPSSSPPRGPAATSSPTSTAPSTTTTPQNPSPSAEPVAADADQPATPSVATLPTDIPGSVPSTAGAEGSSAHTNHDVRVPGVEGSAQPESSEQQTDGASGGASESRSTSHDDAAGSSAGAALPGDRSPMVPKIDPYFIPSETKGRFAALRTAVRALSEVVAKWVRPVFLTSCVVGVVETSMLMLSALVLTLPFTIPTCLNVQLAVPLARFEGLQTKAALEKSKELLDGLRRPFGLACGAAFIGHSVSLPIYEFLNQLLPHRIVLQIPEIPIAMCLGAYCIKFILLHIQWLAPLVFYHKLRRPCASPQVAAASQAA